MATYGISAIHIEDGRLISLRVGLIDTTVPRWAGEQREMSVLEAVDLALIDTLVTIWPDGSPGPKVRTTVGPDGVEGLEAVPGHHFGKALLDLPRF